MMGATSRLTDQTLPGAIPPEFADGATSFHGLTGRSPSMRQVIRQMQSIAPHLGLATIEGEDGTGKTLAARALHDAGPASAGPFIPCLATRFFLAPEAKGEIGWSSDLCLQASHGTLFLDRIHQLDSRQQEHLDNFLHYWSDRRPATESDGRESNRPAAAISPLPAQLVFSSAIDLHSASQSQRAGYGPRFREDLASTLCAVRFRLPPLRERREDIPLLAQLFIQRFSYTYGKQVRGLGPGTIAPLLRHLYPGNVRELEEIIVAASVQTESQWLRPMDLPQFVAETCLRPPAVNISPSDSGEVLNLDDAIRSHVARVLERVRGNKLRAARLLGISRSTLYRILAAEGANFR